MRDCPRVRTTPIPRLGDGPPPTRPWWRDFHPIMPLGERATRRWRGACRHHGRVVGAQHRRPSTFLSDPTVRMVSVEAGGELCAEGTRETSLSGAGHHPRHRRPSSKISGAIRETQFISRGRLPGISTGTPCSGLRPVSYTSVTDQEAPTLSRRSTERGYCRARASHAPCPPSLARGPLNIGKIQWCRNLSTGIGPGSGGTGAKTRAHLRLTGPCFATNWRYISRFQDRLLTTAGVSPPPRR